MIKRIIAMLAVAALTLSCFALAEDTYIDLESRFSDIPTYEYNGVTYYQKDRMTTTLILCAELPADGGQGAGRLEIVILLVTDDDNDTAVPIQLSANMRAAWLEGENGEKTLGELYASCETGEAGAAMLLETVNALFPEAVAEHFFLLDIAGLPILDGAANDDVNVTGEALVERLKKIYKGVESGQSDANEMLSALSGYIYTGMKSGQLMKVVDKADRYDRSSRTPFPVIISDADAAAEAAAEAVLEPDLAAFEEMMISIYYEENRPW